MSQFARLAADVYAADFCDIRVIRSDDDLLWHLAYPPDFLVAEEPVFRTLALARRYLAELGASNRPPRGEEDEAAQGNETPTLTNFLLARIAEDEVEMLRELEAKRRIVACGTRVALTTPSAAMVGYAAAVSEALRALALPYTNHPDFRDEWRT